MNMHRKHEADILKKKLEKCEPNAMMRVDYFNRTYNGKPHRILQQILTEHFSYLFNENQIFEAMRDQMALDDI